MKKCPKCGKPMMELQIFEKGKLKSEAWKCRRCGYTETKDYE